MASQNTFTTTHLHTNRTYTRSRILNNPHYQHHQPLPRRRRPTNNNSDNDSDNNDDEDNGHQTPKKETINPAIQTLQSQLPDYAETPLISLPDVAEELGLGYVFVKNEALRFGLPSFKILGASWAVYRLVCEELGLEAGVVGIEEVRDGVRLFDGGCGGGEAMGMGKEGRRLRLVTCSDGNWGRAVARMGVLLGVRVVVLLPGNIDRATAEKIEKEGEEVKVRRVEGSYDDAIAAAIAEAGGDDRALLVMDTSWEGFEKVPQVGLDFSIRVHMTF